MKIGCVSMVRNIENIVKPFFDQLVAFFDEVIIIDHESYDGAIGYITSAHKNLPSLKLKIYTAVSDVHAQSEIVTYFSRELIERNDFVFILDSDEFINFSDRNELENFLISSGESHCIHLYWENIAPEKMDGSNIFAGGFFTSENADTYEKVIISKRIREVKKWKVSQGSHFIESSEELKITRHNGKLYHIPIQSKLQFVMKFLNGYRILSVDKKNRVIGRGKHWIEYFMLIKDGNLSDRTCIEIGASYQSKIVKKIEDLKIIYPRFTYVKTEYKETNEWLIANIVEKKVNGNNDYFVYFEGTLVTRGKIRLGLRKAIKYYGRYIKNMFSA
ncbi:MAG: hypothetical protein ACP5FQ_07275 [Thermoplasmata archaeon]